MEERVLKFVPEFKSISNRNVLRFSFDDVRYAEDYQFEMLKNNRIPSLLPCEAVTVDGVIRLTYDITSLISLRKILERKEISRPDLIEYLNQLANVFKELENYLLDYGGVLLQSDCIYASPSDNRLYFIYIPDSDMPRDINEPLREFIMHLIIHEMKFKNENADDYLQKLLGVLKNPDFNLKALKACLDGLSKPKPGAVDFPEIIADSRPVQVSSAKNTSPPEKPAQPYIPRIPPKTETKTEKKKVYPLKSYLILGGDILGMIILFGAVILKGTFKPGNPDTLTTLIGLLLVGGAVTYLVCSKAFSADKKVEKVIERKVYIPMPPTGEKSIVKPFAQLAGEKPVVKTVTQAASEKPVVTALSQAATGNVEYVNKTIRQPEMNEPAVNRQLQADYNPTPQDSDRTVLLSGKNISVPTIRRLGPNQETVMIHRWPFRMGRLAEQVDYCILNPAVGKLHAELIKKSDGYFITDMNTRNGTFVNGNRIEANSEQPLKDGDQIMLANEEFIFNV